MEKLILVRYGEIYLKGQNRPFFERTLVDNIKKVLGNYYWERPGQERDTEIIVLLLKLNILRY